MTIRTLVEIVLVVLRLKGRGTWDSFWKLIWPCVWLSDLALTWRWFSRTPGIDFAFRSRIAQLDPNDYWLMWGTHCATCDELPLVKLKGKEPKGLLSWREGGSRGEPGWTPPYWTDTHGIDAHWHALSEPSRLFAANPTRSTGNWLYALLFRPFLDSRCHSQPLVTPSDHWALVTSDKCLVIPGDHEWLEMAPPACASALPVSVISVAPSGEIAMFSIRDSQVASC